MASLPPLSLPLPVLLAPADQIHSTAPLLAPLPAQSAEACPGRTASLQASQSRSASEHMESLAQTAILSAASVSLCPNLAVQDTKTHQFIHKSSASSFSFSLTIVAITSPERWQKHWHHSKTREIIAQNHVDDLGFFCVGSILALRARCSLTRSLCCAQRQRAWPNNPLSLLVLRIEREKEKTPTLSLDVKQAWF